MEIKKKCWPDLFQKVLDGKKNADVRLADFDISEGDVLVFEEYDPDKKEYTGRVIKKKVKNLNKIKVTDFNSKDEVEKFGHWVIELENV